MDKYYEFKNDGKLRHDVSLLNAYTRETAEKYPKDRFPVLSYLYRGPVFLLSAILSLLWCGIGYASFYIGTGLKKVMLPVCLVTLLLLPPMVTLLLSSLLYKTSVWLFILLFLLLNGAAFFVYFKKRILLPAAVITGLFYTVAAFSFFSRGDKITAALYIFGVFIKPVIFFSLLLLAAAVLKNSGEVYIKGADALFYRARAFVSFKFFKKHCFDTVNRVKSLNGKTFSVLPFFALLPLRDKITAVLCVLCVILNVIGYFVYRADKRKAVKGKRRTPEKTLLTFAAIAPLGSFDGMKGIGGGGKHKLSKWYFPTVAAVFCTLEEAIFLPLLVKFDYGAAVSYFFDFFLKIFR